MLKLEGHTVECIPSSIKYPLSKAWTQIVIQITTKTNQAFLGLPPTGAEIFTHIHIQSFKLSC